MIWLKNQEFIKIVVIGCKIKINSQHNKIKKLKTKLKFVKKQDNY